MEKLIGLAIAVQVIVEGVARLYPRGTVYVASAVGVLVAVLTHTGLLASMGISLGADVVSAYTDYVLAGLVIAGGAGVVQGLKNGLSKPTSTEGQ